MHQKWFLEDLVLTAYTTVTRLYPMGFFLNQLKKDLLTPHQPKGPPFGNILGHLFLATNPKISN